MYYTDDDQNLNDYYSVDCSCILFCRPQPVSAVLLLKLLSGEMYVICTLYLTVVTHLQYAVPPVPTAVLYNCKVINLNS
jgi:hypothetical protein